MYKRQVLREGYTLGAPVAGSYKEILNSDDAEFGGSGAVHNKAVRTHKKPMHGFEQSITITLPPMSTLYFEVPAKRTRKAAADKTDKAGKKTAAKKAKTAAEKAAAKVVKKPGRKPKAEAAAAEDVYKRQVQPLPGSCQCGLLLHKFLCFGILPEGAFHG